MTELTPEEFKVRVSHVGRDGMLTPSPQILIAHDAALRAERDALRAALEEATADFDAAMIVVKHLEGYAASWAIRAGVSDLTVGLAPDILVAGERYRAATTRARARLDKEAE